MRSFKWRKALSSEYLWSASSYLGLKLAIFSLVGLVSQYLLTRSLSRGDYGLLIWVSTIVSLLAPFGLPGISTSITGAVAKGYDGNFRRGTWLEMAGGTVGGLVLLGFACYYRFWIHEETKVFIFLIAGILGPGLWLDTHQCFWNGKRNFRALFWWAVPVRALQLAATAGVLYFSTNPVWVFGVQTLIQVAANIGAAIGIMRFGGINKETSEEYYKYGRFSTKLYWIGAVTTQLDKLIIGAFFGLESLAVFAVGELFYTYFYKTPASILTQMFLPRLAEMEIGQAARWVKERLSSILLVTTLMILLVGITIPTIYHLMFSSKYTESIFYAYLFLGCIALGSPSILGGVLHKSHAIKKYTFRGWLIVTLTPLVLIPLFGLILGITGIIAARAVTNALLSVYYFLMLRRLSTSMASS